MNEESNNVEKSGAVTLRMIADEVGVSTSTVSRALQHHPRISSEMVAKVEAVAKRLGYEPNPRIRRYMAEMRQMQTAGVRELVAFVGGMSPKAGSYIEDLWKGASERAKQLGYQPEFFLIEDLERDSRVARRVFHARNISGVLLLPFRDPQVYLELGWDEVAAVSMTKISQRLPLHGVHGDQLKKFEAIMDLVVANKSRRPGLIMWGSCQRRFGRLLTSCYHWMWDEVLDGGKVPPFLWDGPGIDVKLRGWFDKHRPDALIVCGTNMRDAAIEVLGKKRTRTVRWVSYSDVKPSEKIAGICTNYQHVGQAAADLLTSMLTRGERGFPEAPQHVTIRGKLVGTEHLVFRA